MTTEASPIRRDGSDGPAGPFRRLRAWSRLGILLGATAAGTALLTPGCASDPVAGYSSEPVFRSDIRTIAVPIFENDTFERGVEFDLTEAIVKEIEARTPWKVTARGRADSILTGHVRRVDLDQLSKSPLTGLGEEVLFGVTIDFEWTDLRRDERLVERRGYSGQGLFVPSNPTSERIDLGRMAAVRQLASDIVDEMRSSW